MLSRSKYECMMLPNTNIRVFYLPVFSNNLYAINMTNPDSRTLVLWYSRTLLW